MIKGLLIGNPVDKSVSHVTHNEIFEKLNINATYEKRLISLEKLEEEVADLKKSDFAFFAVTMPLKEVIVPYLDVDTSGFRCVNTILVKDGKWIGFNFDGIGCLNAIERVEKVDKKKVLILGSGGAAKAAIFEAKNRGAEVFIYNRTFERAQKLAAELGVTALSEVNSTFDVIIQATSLGMFSDELPLSLKWVGRDTVVMEMVCNPRETYFVKKCIEKGVKVVFGYEMFAELTFLQLHLAIGSQIDKDLVIAVVKKFFS